jgi:anti-anti-sigma regulatory factor
MAAKKHTVADELKITVSEEPDLIRFGLSGSAFIHEAQAIRDARDRYQTSNLPVLVVDDGLTTVDTVAYGALVQWAFAVRNRNIGWVMATPLPIAGRMFQMAGLIPEEVLYVSEDAARKALDRGHAGMRVANVTGGVMAIEGLRRK